MSPARLHQPLHRDLATTIRRQIRDGAFAVGDKIPTEVELCQWQGVSRNTVRQAVDHLVDEGVLDRRQGRGTFVRALPKPDPALFGPAPDQTWAFRLVDHGWRTASIDLANLFGLPPDDEIFCMTRLRLDGDKPTAIKRYYAPADLLRDTPPTKDEIDGGLFDAIILARGVRLMRMNLTARPVLLASADAALMDVDPGGLSLITQRVGFNEHGRAVRLSETVLAGNHARLFWSVRRPYGERGRGEALNVSTWTAAAFD